MDEKERKLIEQELLELGLPKALREELLALQELDLGRPDPDLPEKVMKELERRGLFRSKRSWFRKILARIFGR